MNKLEKSWVMYDVGNSAFMMLVTTIIPIYFKNMAAAAGVSGSDSTAYWGYAVSISTLIVAILGPMLGALGDHKGYKKRLFLSFVGIGVFGCAALSLPVSWGSFLIIFVFAKVGLSGSLIFNDAMLPDITSDDRTDLISSYGYAFGYIGSCIPFTLCLCLILTAGRTGITAEKATMLSFYITALWWLLATLPLARRYQQIHYVETCSRPFAESLSRLWKTLTHVRENRKIFTFLLAFFLYIDGVYTIIEMATSYGKDVGVTDSHLLLALLLTQIVAFPCALFLARLSKRMETSRLISAAIIGYIAITLFALQLDKAWEFWLLAVCVAMFQGGLQALSRSYFSRIVPKEKISEFFGIYDIFGKGAAFFGTLAMSFVTQMTGHSRYGVMAVTLSFLVGFLFFRLHLRLKTEH